MKTKYNHLAFIFYVYLAGLVIFTLFRITLLFSQINELEKIPDLTYHLLNSFWFGLRFDTVISSYFLILPFFLLSILKITTTIIKKYKLNKNPEEKIENSQVKINIILNKTLLYFVSVYLSILYGAAFLICSADIPFFNHFFTRLTVAVLTWIDTPLFCLQMIIQEPFFLLFAIIAICLIIAFSIFVFKLKNKYLKSEEIFSLFVPHKLNKKNSFQILKLSVFSVLILLLLFAGARGRVAIKSPIRIGTAYFSNYAFPNMLGLNPVFTFIESIIEKNKKENQSINLMDKDNAIKNLQKHLNITQNYSTYPIAREYFSDSSEIKANVIVVIMESMSYEKFSFSENGYKLTPFLDSISNKSLLFSNAYTAGIHTYNGIYSTIFSYPAIFNRHPMNVVEIPKYYSMPQIFEEKGYSTIYFTTHDEQFDNIAGFLSYNSFQKIVSQKDYPGTEIESTLGIPDHLLFKHSISYLNELSKSGKPFFATLLTSSDHDPKIIPEGISFKSHFKDISKSIVEYADWSIQYFLELASKESWFENTLFVFVADHGAKIKSSIYDVPLDYHHSPLIFYFPKRILPSKSENLAGQIDIFPTIMGLLNFNYINNTFGIDLNKEKREFIYFCTDDNIGCINNEFLYIYRKKGKESLYNYKENSAVDLINQLNVKADSMRTYCFSALQTAEWQIKNKKTGKPNAKVTNR
ncbi:MAG TPA: sulfatase-like hydrolase/transferase [Candidatus Kapabacteria bacterium]|nr:sulfatase-like hydrolase/transferase [Candidatus Kapabacteria bacterium]